MITPSPVFCISTSRTVGASAVSVGFGAQMELSVRILPNISDGNAFIFILIVKNSFAKISPRRPKFMAGSEKNH